MFKYLSIIALSACSTVVADTGSPLDEEFPQERWSCEHIETPHSAFVEAQTIVHRDYTDIEFRIRDGDQSHILPMEYKRNGKWYVKANLLFLDCNSRQMGAFYAYWE